MTVHSFAFGTHCNDQILQAGANFDMSNPVVKELCAYAYQVEKQLQNTGKCFVYQTSAQGSERSACAAAWLALMKLSGMKPEIDPGQALGHAPDTCAGGNPNAGGCFIPMNSRCNSHIGSTCPMRAGQCYNKVIFRIEDGAGNWWEVDCSSVSSQQKSAWTTAINKRKSEFACNLCELVDKMNDLYGDYADWPDVSPSPPTGVVSVKRYIETCLCCVIPVCQKLELEP